MHVCVHADVYKGCTFFVLRISIGDPISAYAYRLLHQYNALVHPLEHTSLNQELS